MLPNSHLINRGKLNFKGVVEEAVTLGCDRLMVLERWKGAPGKIELYTLKPSVEHYYPIIYLASVRSQDEIYGRASVGGKPIATVPENAPELRRFSEALANFLQIPLVTSERDVKKFSAGLVFDAEESKAVVTFRRPHDGMEIGPRLTIKNLIWSDRG